MWQSTDPQNTGAPTLVGDNCSLVTVTHSDESTQEEEGCGHYSYEITRTWYATDECENVMSCTQHISVEDTTAPTLSCPADAVVECDESTDPQNTGAPTLVGDNCSLVTVTHSDESTQEEEGCGHYSYEITRTWYATDECENVTSCTQHISVEDTTPPTLSCPADAIVECDESTDPQNTGAPTLVGDNCSLVTVTHSDEKHAGRRRMRSL